MDDQFMKDMELSRPYTAKDREEISITERVLESISRLLTDLL